MVTCKICNLRLLSHSRKLSCFFCHGAIHLKCLPNVTIHDSVYTSRATNNWLCPLCAGNELPFNHFIDDDKFHNAISDQHDRFALNMKRLENVIFDPFEINDENMDNPLLQSDPDLQYYNDVTYIEQAKNCDYYIEETFNQRLTNLNVCEECFSVFHLNIRSIPKNLARLQNYLSCLHTRFKVIGITETWLTIQTVDLYGMEGYQHFASCREKKRGGGLSFYISNELTVKNRDDLHLMTDSAEAMFIELSKDETGLNKNVVIGLIYRPPNQDIKIFNELISEKLNMTKNENKLLYVMGDFNIDILKHDDHLATSEFLETLYSYVLFPLISKPTRIAKETATLIDNIFSSDFANESSLNGLLFTDISDHLPIFSIHSIAKTSEKTYTFKRRFHSNQNVDAFINKLNCINWDLISQNDNGNEAFQLFHSTFSRVYDECFPLITVKHNYKNRKPWLTKGIKKSIKIKNQLYLKQLRYRTCENITMYKVYKGNLTKLMRRMERAHYNELIEENKKNSKKLWSIIKSVVNNKKTSSTPTQFRINNNLVNNRELIANSFNSYFSNVGKDLAEKIPITAQNPLSYITESNSNSIFLTPVTSEEVKRIILSLKNASPGYDGVHAEIIKKTYHLYLLPLVHLLNLSLSQGFFPDSMKIAKIIPIYKAGDVTNIGNYRPVSVLPLFSKIFESVMHARLIKFIDKYQLLYKYQFGFRKNHNTGMAVTILTDKIISAIDAGQTVLGVFLDFKKAFDTVNHGILIDKLARYGIRNTALSWIEDYLRNRVQFVSFDNVNSRYLSVNCGVPQGSILGPLLFLLYINDIVNVSTLLTPIIYADDTNVFIKGKDIQEAAKNMNYELTKIVKWLNCNRLSLNVSKTHYMIFKGRNRRIGPYEKICINGTVIDCVENTRFVGVTLDSNFKWDGHISHTKSKMAKGMGILCKARRYFTKSTLITLYYSMIYPYLTYCVESWGNSANIYIASLVKLQKKIIRIITSSPFRASTEPLFEDLKLLNILQTYKHQIALFMYKFVKGMLPTLFNTMFVRCSEVMSRITRNSQKIYVPLCKTALYKNSIKGQGPIIWNDVGEKIDHRCSIHTFKKRLKRHIIQHV